MKKFSIFPSLNSDDSQSRNSLSICFSSITLNSQSHFLQAFPLVLFLFISSSSTSLPPPKLSDFIQVFSPPLCSLNFFKNMFIINRLDVIVSSLHAS